MLRIGTIVGILFICRLKLVPACLAILWAFVAVCAQHFQYAGFDSIITLRLILIGVPIVRVIRPLRNKNLNLSGRILWPPEQTGRINFA